VSATPAHLGQPDHIIGRDGKSYPRRRELRKLRPDAEPFRRRARGVSPRTLAADYGPDHSTLARFMERLER